VTSPADPTLFEVPSAPGTAPRQVDVDKLIAVERAAAAVVEPVGRLWQELAVSTDAAISMRTLDGVLRNALSTMAQVMSVDTVSILLANEAGDELAFRASIGLSEELTVGIGIRAGEGMAGRVLASGQPLVVGDLSAIHVVNPVLRDSGLRSVAAVPLLSGGRCIGVLYAASYQLDRFTETDAELLQVVADRLAAALDRVRIFEREREARREAEQLADRIGRMQRVTAELATADTATQVAAVLVRFLETDAPAWVGVWLRQDERLVPVAQSGTPPPGWGGTVVTDGTSAVAQAVRQERPIYGDGPGTVYAVLPIVCRDGCAGALSVVHERDRPIPSAERALLSAVVGQAAQAFDRAQLMAAQQRAAEHATFFARAAQALAEANDLGATLDRLGDLAVAALGEICLIDVLNEDGHLTRMVARHRDPRRQPETDRLRAEFAPDPEGEHPAVLAISAGRSLWSDHLTEAFLRSTCRNEEHLALVQSLGFHSYVTVPLVAERRVLGSVTSVSCSRAFQPDDVAFAEQLAYHVAAVVDNARRFDLTSRTSHILQSSLLPGDLPTVDGVSVATRYLTANRGLEVGGDFYDVLLLPSGAVLFAVGDVAGHDRHAAAQMGHLRSATRALAGQVSSPAELLDSLRSSWELLGFERIATALVGSIHPASGRLTLASAGHYPPLVVGAAGSPRFIPVEPAPPLGMTGPVPHLWEGALAPGEVLLAYTDGAIDERGAGAEASMTRLSRMAAAGTVSPGAVCDRVVAVLAPDRADDVALLALSLARGG
jgi:GAF domain-containing protein